MSLIKNLFTTASVRKQLLITLAIIVVFRFGSLLPAPGVDYMNLQAIMGAQGSDADFVGLLNLVSGGALLQLSVFALGVMPYITASIIFQLLRVVVPRFEALHKEGQTGQAKLTQYTRYLTLGLGVLQAGALVVSIRGGALLGGPGADGSGAPIFIDESWWTSVVFVLTLVAGTGVVMWLAEQVTERGIGNGMSLLIFISIIAALPAALWNAGSERGLGALASIVALLLVLVAVVVFVEQSQRRIKVQYAKRQVGSKTYGGTSTYIPLKVNMAGVVPVIFASSILMLPMLAGQFVSGATWLQSLALWAQDTTSWSYLLSLALLVGFFAFFYAGITFNTDEQAQQLKTYGGFIPGVRPGTPTAQYLKYVLDRLTSAGALYLVAVALIPTVIFAALGITSIPFGGTSLLIVVSVALDTVKQARARVDQFSYEGLLKSS